MPINKAAYESHKQRCAERSRELSAVGREISGSVPLRDAPWPTFANADAFAAAFPQTPVVVARVLHAALTGQYGFVALVGHTRRLARASLQAVRLELEGSDALYRAFPEICHVVRAVGGIGQRRPLFCGQWIGATIHPDEIRLPILPTNPAAGVRLVAVKRTRWPKTCPQVWPEFSDDPRPRFVVEV